MKQKTKWQQRGQSLVEVAVFLPVALIIIAGLVELSLFLVTQNRVTTASREAARFGANGGQDSGMVLVALNSVTQTLQLEVDRWDMWAIRGRVRARCLNGTNGTATLDFGPNDVDFVVQHSYGISQTVAYTETNTFVRSNAFRQEVLQELAAGGIGGGVSGCSNPSTPAPDINGLQFVGMYTSHDVASILGLDVFLENVFTVKALQVFRVTSVVSNNQTRGCDAFPIALFQGRRTVNVAEYAAFVGANYPTRYPTSLPTWDSLLQDGHIGSSEHSLDNAQEGDVFLFTGEGRTDPNYAWLQWNTDTACAGCNNPTTRLQTSLGWPGNAQSATLGFHEVGDWADADLNVQDLVKYSAVAGVNAQTVMSAHIDRHRTLRVLLWFHDPGDTGTLDGHDWIRVKRFVNVRILAYNFNDTNANRKLLVQFVSQENSCGQVAGAP